MFRLAVPLLSGLLAFMPVVDNQPIATEPTLYSLNYTIEKTSYVPYHKVFGEKQDIIDEQIIDKLISNFEYNLNRHFTIYLVDKVSVDYYLGVAFDNNKIYLFPEEEKYVLDTLYHELGHLAYFELTNKERNEWKKFRQVPTGLSENSEYDFRPSEIFANDFNILFNHYHDDKKDLEKMYYYNYPIPFPSDNIVELKEYVISLGV